MRSKRIVSGSISDRGGEVVDKTSIGHVRLGDAAIVRMFLAGHEGDGLEPTRAALIDALDRCPGMQLGDKVWGAASGLGGRFRGIAAADVFGGRAGVRADLSTFQPDSTREPFQRDGHDERFAEQRRREQREKQVKAAALKAHLGAARPAGAPRSGSSRRRDDEER